MVSGRKGDGLYVEAALLSITRTPVEEGFVLVEVSVRFQVV